SPCCDDSAGFAIPTDGGVVVNTGPLRLPSPRETGEDASVEVLETRPRRRPKASRHRLTSGTIIAVLLEIPRT
ncbi:MAG: hypothetical protein M3138_11530, partial [Actinomycetota bacterium]|nr:hypothetical protein [Actinomycetota bacterium]